MGSRTNRQRRGGGRWGRREGMYRRRMWVYQRDGGVGLSVDEEGVDIGVEG
jgi:hypothetical protein